jgi:hypothetical protein
LAEDVVQIEYKSADPGTSTVLGIDEEQGIVRALVSVTGVEDRQKDVIVPGAYARTLNSLKPFGLRYPTPKTGGEKGSA